MIIEIKFYTLKRFVASKSSGLKDKHIIDYEAKNSADFGFGNKVFWKLS